MRGLGWMVSLGAGLMGASAVVLVAELADMPWWAGALTGIAAVGLGMFGGRAAVDPTWPRWLRVDDSGADEGLDLFRRADPGAPLTWAEVNGDDTVIFDRARLGLLDRQQPGRRRAGMR